DLAQPLRQRHAGRRLSFARFRRRDGRDDNDLAAFARGEPVENRQLHLAAKLAVLFQLVRQDAGVVGDIGNPAQPGVVSNFQRSFHRCVLPALKGPAYILWGGPFRPAGYFPSSFRTIRAPSTIAVSFANATSRGRWTHPQSGLMTRRSAGTTSSARRMRSATSAGDSMSWVLTSMTPRPSVNGALNSLNSWMSSSPRRANSSDSAWTLASRMVGNKYL